jgi:hypothetical protein
MQQLLHAFYILLFNSSQGGVDMPSARTRSLQGSDGAEDEVIRFARNLARTFGALARFHVCRSSPPAIVESSDAAKQPGAAAEVLSAVRDFAAGSRVVSRPAGPGLRLSVLALPGPRADGLVLVAEVDSGTLARAARLLATLADPEGTNHEAATEHLGTTVGRMLDAAESELGVRTSEMSRSQKQQVVKELDERGAFLIKKSVEQVAERLGVSRFTIYNYLDQVNRESESGADGPAGLPVSQGRSGADEGCG